MLITKEDAGKCITRIIKFLNRHNVGSLEDLDHFMDSKHYIGATDFFVIDERPVGNFFDAFAVDKSNLQTVQVISYMRTGVGKLLEVIINTNKQYSTITIKGDFTREKYKIFGTDKFGNKAQERKIYSIYLTKIKEELEKLI